MNTAIRHKVDRLCRTASWLVRQGTNAAKRRAPSVPPPADCMLYAERCFRAAEMLDAYAARLADEAVHAA